MSTLTFRAGRHGTTFTKHLFAIAFMGVMGGKKHPDDCIIITCASAERSSFHVKYECPKTSKRISLSGMLFRKVLRRLCCKHDALSRNASPYTSACAYADVSTKLITSYQSANGIEFAYQIISTLSYHTIWYMVDLRTLDQFLEIFPGMWLC